MDRKRQRELALAAPRCLLLAIAVWSMQRGTASPVGARRTGAAPAASTQRSRPKSPIAEVDLEALEAERPEPEDSDEKSVQVQAEACAAAAVAGGHQTAAASRRGCTGSDAGRSSRRRRRAFR